MALHRYWRIYMTASTSGSDMVLAFYEIEMRGSVGGADQCNGGTPSASHYTENAYKLFNNNPSDYWINYGPSADTWIVYDFGVGVAVNVAELRLLARNTYQSPTAFSLEYSEDGSLWNSAASWSGVTGWISGVEKLFVPPPTLVGGQSDHPFAMALAADGHHPYASGEWCHRQCATVYGLLLSGARHQPWEMGEVVRGVTQGFSHWVEGAIQQPFSPILSLAHTQPWQQFISHANRQPLFYTLHQKNQQVCSVHHGVWADHSQPIVATWALVGSLKHPFTLHLRNPVASALLGFWDLATHHCIIRSSAPVLTLAAPAGVGTGLGRPLPLHKARVTHTAEAFGWSATLHLAREADFAALTLDDSFMIQINGEPYTLLVDGKQLYRTGDGRVERILYGISPAARHASPRGAVVGQEWSGSLRAREAVELLLGESVEWLLPDWRIPAGGLRVADRLPMVCAQQIAESVGGVVQSRPAGQVVVRPRFPCSVPEWSTATPHHLLTDSQDILAMRMVQESRARVDQVVVRTGPVAGSLGAAAVTLQADRRPEGPNQGRKHFFPGEAAHIVMTPRLASETLQVTTSAGLLRSAGPLQWQRTEDLAFVASNQAKLTTPMVKLLSVQWLGNGLGVPVVQGDGLTLRTPLAGTAVARVTYEVAAEGYTVQVPAQMAGQEPFSILVTASGWRAGAGFLEVAMQRGAAEYPVQRVVAPLLANHYLLSLRAKAELDQGDALQRVELTILYRPGLEPGQLVAVQDGGYGRTFRGVVREVSHELERDGWVSRLVLWR